MKICVFQNRNVVSHTLLPMRTTRYLAALLLLCLASFSLTAWADHEAHHLRIGIGASVLKLHPEAMPAWQQYLSAQLKRPVEFVQRDTYRQMMDVVKQQEVDFAWLSTFPYAYMAKRGRVKLLVAPMTPGKGSSYAAYLLVPATDTRSRSIEDLRGSIFAFTDPYSLTGYQVPLFWLRQLGERDPKHFFRKTFFTHAHGNTIAAVASGLADGGMVDSYAWDRAVSKEPALSGQLRIVTRSVDFGFPPIVSVPKVSAQDAAALRDVLLAMARNEEGQRLLKMVGLSGFEIADPRRYRNLAPMLDSADKP